MSLKAIEAVLTRAMSDAVFAKSLFANAETSLAEYDLTREEIAAFKEMSINELNTLMQASPEERKSFWVVLNHTEKILLIH